MYKILISLYLLSLITPCQMQPSFSSRSAKGNFLLSSANFFVFVFRFPFFPTDSGVPAKFLGGRKKNPFPSFSFLPYSNLIRLRSLAPCPLFPCLFFFFPPTTKQENPPRRKRKEEGPFPPFLRAARDLMRSATKVGGGTGRGMGDGDSPF